MRHAIASIALLLAPAAHADEIGTCQPYASASMPDGSTVGTILGDPDAPDWVTLVDAHGDWWLYVQSAGTICLVATGHHFALGKNLGPLGDPA